MARVILVTGFEPFATHTVNPTEGLAKAVDGRQIGGYAVRSAVLPVHHADAAGRARIALERVAVNVMDYEVPDNAGVQATGQPCVPGGPAAYFTTLPLPALLKALGDEGIPAYVSNTAGTYLCNQTLYWTLHHVRDRAAAPRVGFVHFPLLPAMVAAAGLEQPSMDFPLMLRAVEAVLAVVAEPAPVQ
jgi:pyroglutamyl-peptidase